MNRRRFLEGSLLGGASSIVLRPTTAPATRNRPEATHSRRELVLSDSAWKLGAFSLGEGERRHAFLSDFDDSDFKTVRVPGEVQVQIGLEGMDRYYQSSELSLINEREWWYRKKFRVSDEHLGKLSRLLFDGVDYFSTVWLNGEKLGDHEGGFVPFLFDVSNKLQYDRENTLALRVTCPWIPKDRGFLEYMKGEWTMSDPANVVRFSFPPYVLGPYWDGIPAAGNAAFPMGLWRDVRLITSGHAVTNAAWVETRDIRPDGSATLEISGTVENHASQELSVSLELKIEPDNFTGESLSLPKQHLTLHPGENRFRAGADIQDAHLWWTWDLGRQNLYRLVVTLSGESREVAERTVLAFGIRTIRRERDMSYWLNGKRLFLKGAWYPMADYFGSVPTHETYKKDLELFRAANLNHLVNFTVVEKANFYDLCDRLGILVMVEYPFSQFGPEEVLSYSNPRRELFVKESLGQLSQITNQLRNHPSIVVWDAFAEAHQKGGVWGVENLDLEKYGYAAYSDAIGKLVSENDPGTIYQPSFCDLGEQHFWMANAGMGTKGGYNQHFYANTGFVSEYGSIALPSLESLGKMLTPEEIWSNSEKQLPQWSNLPIDISAYAYQASFEYNGFASMLRRVDQYVDRHIRSAQELVDGSQLYQAFLLKYATEAYRRRKYSSINGTRIWAYGEVTPGIRFGFIDYFRVPKIGYYYLKRSQERFALNFAYEEALESQPCGRDLHIPLWVINDHRRKMSFDLHCEICDVNGRVVWTKNSSEQIESDEARPVSTIDWLTPEQPGVYILRAQASEREGELQVTDSTFIKVTPRLFSRKVRMLLIGERKYSVAVAAMAQAMAISVEVIDEEQFAKLALLQDSERVRREYDLVWLTSFDSLWKLLNATDARGLKAAIHNGLSFVHTGGPGSFHGGFGRAACLDFTPLADVLPVTLKRRNDLVFGPVHQATAGLAEEFSPIKDIEVSTGADAQWSDCGLSKYGLPAFNEVATDDKAEVIMRVCGKPLLVLGRFGAGRTVAFTGFTPVYAEETAYWNDKIVFPYLLDQVFYEEPASQAYFSLFMRMISAAVEESPAVDYEEVLAARAKPLFEMLKDLPAANVVLPQGLKSTASGRQAAVPIKIRNGPAYARLVRLRVEWNEPEDRAPFLEIYSDNYFDLFPGASRTIAVDVFPRDGSRGSVSGIVTVEGANLARQEIPLELQFT